MSAPAVAFEPVPRPRPKPQPITIPLVPEFCFAHEPIQTLTERPFVGRQEDLEEFIMRVEHSAGGSFLITGYRGVGKTSFVNQALSLLRARSTVLDIYLNLARPLQEAELMHLIIRRIYDRLIEKGWYDSLSPALQRRITLAYQRTSANVVRKVAEGWERGLELGASSIPVLKIPLAPKFTGKNSRTVNFETSFLAYDDKAAEHDVITIARELALGISQRETRWRGFWRRLHGIRPSVRMMKIVFVFDELDKLDDQTAPGEPSEVEKMLTGLKNLFTTSGMCFLFIAGKDLHERWLRDVSRGDSVFESVFSYDKYLPCMWTDVDALCDQFTATHGAAQADSQAEICLDNLKQYLRFRGRGIPRRVLRAFNEMVAWQENRPVLRFSNDRIKRLTFYSRLNRCLERNAERLFGSSMEDLAGTRLDRLKLGIYYVVDWILLRAAFEFTAADVLSASRDLSSRITLAEEVAIGRIGQLLEVLIEGEYIEIVPQKLDEVAINGEAPGREKRYRITPRRLAELSGINVEAGEEPSAPAAQTSQLKQIAGYELHELLGQGGMGSVYLAWDTNAHRFVALKLLHSSLASSPVARERFRRESATLERLRHANIVSVLEAGEWEGQFFLAMDYVEGIDLDRILAQSGALNVETALAILQPIGAAVEYAHKQGVFRLDVKPGNVRVGTSGHVYLMDLGIAREDAGADQSITREGTYIGTPFYLAPEQIGPGPIDQRVDIYAYGRVLYETVTGRRPFPAENASEVLMQHLTQEPPPPSLFAKLPPSLEIVILRCLAKSRDARYNSMTALLAEIERCASQVRRVEEKELAELAKGVASQVKREEYEKSAKTMIAAYPGATSSEQQPPPPSSPISGVGLAYAPAPMPAYSSSPVPPLPSDTEEKRAITLPVATSPGVWRIDGNARTEWYPLNSEITTIGRDPSNDICLATASGPNGVSRYHARIERSGDSYRLTDLNSSNGTYVNRVRVLEHVPLHDGDQIDIGDVQLSFQSPIPAAA